jgi:cbb3-type cytochrome oxidase subunit 3
MKPEDRRLARHLAVAVVLKLLVLCALWWAFARDARVNTDAEQTAEHIGVNLTPQGAPR